MKLSDASKFFDRTPALDVATGRVLFRCQIDPYDDSKRDAAPAYRRIMSVAPGTAMPASRVVKALGKTWIIGNMEPDGLSELHREKYVVHMATDSLKVSTLSGFLAGTVASTVMASPSWVKDAKQLEVSSETPQIFDITLPKGSGVLARQILWTTDYAYLVLSNRPMASGLEVASALWLSQPLPLVGSLVAQVYDPVPGIYSAPAPTNVNMVKVRWQSLFEYGSQMSERFQEGDWAIVMPVGTVTSTSTKLTLEGINYQVLAVMDMAGAVVAHARKA